MMRTRLQSQLPVQPAARQRGFTLMEILIGTVAFALILGSMKVVFQGALQLRNKSFEVVDEAAPRDWAATIIRRDLSSMLVSGGALASEILAEPLNTSRDPSDQIDFYCTSAAPVPYQPWPDLQWVRYTLAPSIRPAPTGFGSGSRSGSRGQATDSLDLVRSVERNVLAPVQELPEELRLLEGVRSMDLQFYDGESWLDTWDSATEEPQAPLAVRMRIDFVQPEQQAQTRNRSSQRTRAPLELFVLTPVRPGEFPEAEAEVDADVENSEEDPGQTDSGAPTDDGGGGGGNNNAPAGGQGGNAR